MQPGPFLSFLRTAQQAGPGPGGTGVELSPNGNGYRETGLASVPDSTASFVQVGKTLFVTSTNGGAHDCGAIYEFTGAAGFTPTDVYDFCTTPNDGVSPDSALVADSSGALYGTANSGGTIGSGTVFKFVPNKSGGTGTLTNLYNFDAFSGDGRFPYGSVTLDSKGNIYGTTQSGGSANYGTIFRLSPGKGQLYVEKILHSFKGMPDAENPTAALALIGSKLYGTANEGGKAGLGAIYTVETSGSLYSVVHDFAGGADGEYRHTVRSSLATARSLERCRRAARPPNLKEPCSRTSRKTPEKWLMVQGRRGDVGPVF